MLSKTEKNFICAVLEYDVDFSIYDRSRYNWTNRKFTLTVLLQ